MELKREPSEQARMGLRLFVSKNRSSVIAERYR